MLQPVSENVRCSLISTNSYSVFRVVVEVRHSLQQARSLQRLMSAGMVVILQESGEFSFQVLRIPSCYAQG
jgi:hypothetical protein